MNFSDNTTPTVLAAYDYDAIRSARRSRIARRTLRFIYGCFLAFGTIGAFLEFMETGKVWWLAGATWVAISMVVVMYPLFNHHELSTDERKIQQCLDQISQ